MKYLLATICAVFLLGGCSAFTTMWYGPDLTPEQLKDKVYKEAYALGVIVAKKNANIETEVLTEQAMMLLDVAEPGNYLTEKWMHYVIEGDLENAALYYTARKLYDRLGVKVDDQLNDPENPIITTLDLDINLFKFALNAYIDGVKAARS